MESDFKTGTEVLEEESKARTEILQVAVNKKEKSLIEKAAEDKYTSISQFCRLAILEKLNAK